jgi:hypothetical protein
MEGEVAAADVASGKAGDAVPHPSIPMKTMTKPLPDELTAYRVADRLFANTYLHCE